MDVINRVFRRIARKNYLNLRARIVRLGNTAQNKETNIVPLSEYLEIVANADTCTYCGIEFQGLHDLEIDHITAFDKGGTSIAENLTPSCTWCNQAKGNRPVQDFVQWLKGVDIESLRANPPYQSWTEKVAQF